MTVYHLAALDVEIPRSGPVTYEWGDDKPRETIEKLRPGVAVEMLSHDYDEVRELGRWGRILYDGEIVMIWSLHDPRLAMPSWYATDQLFGMLCQYRPWAEVAFFKMNADGDLRQLKIPND